MVRVSNLPADDNYVLSLADVPPAEGAEPELTLALTRIRALTLTLTLTPTPTLTLALTL